MQTSAVTDVIIPSNALQDMKVSWPAQIRQAQLMMQTDNGSYIAVPDRKNPFKSTDKAYKDVNPENYLPSHISADAGTIGMKLTGPDGKTYIATGLDDKLTGSMGDVARIQAPFITGEMGDFSIDITTTGGGQLQMAARSKVEVPAMGKPFLKVEVQVGPDQWEDVRNLTGDPSLIGEKLAHEKKIQGAQQYFKNSNVHSNYLEFGDAKQYFDATNFDN